MPAPQPIPACLRERQHPAHQPACTSKSALERAGLPGPRICRPSMYAGSWLAAPPGGGCLPAWLLELLRCLRASMHARKTRKTHTPTHHRSACLGASARPRPPHSTTGMCTRLRSPEYSTKPVWHASVHATRPLAHKQLAAHLYMHANRHERTSCTHARTRMRKFSQPNHHPPAPTPQACRDGALRPSLWPSLPQLKAQAKRGACNGAGFSLRVLVCVSCLLSVPVSRPQCPHVPTRCCSLLTDDHKSCGRNGRGRLP